MVDQRTIQEALRTDDDEQITPLVAALQLKRAFASDRIDGRYHGLTQRWLISADTGADQSSQLGQHAIDSTQITVAQKLHESMHYGEHLKVLRNSKQSKHSKPVLFARGLPSVS